MILMQSAKRPSINMVVLGFIDIETSLRGEAEDDFLEEEEGESDQFQRDLCRQLNCLQERVRPFTEMELLGALLDPEMKNIEKIRDESPSKNTAKFLLQAVKKYVSERFADEDTVIVSMDSPSKKQRCSLIAKYASLTRTNGTLRNEVDRYLAHVVQLDNSSDNRVLEWWHANSTTFPTLATLARIVLSIPATSAEPERRFSAAGNCQRERRCSLEPITMSKSLFIHDNKLFLPDKRLL